jgi:acyl-CoA synthetase (AMP-forming)/AMP-acid ligase II
VLTMSSALDRARRYYSHKKAIVDPEGTWTWGEHLDRVARAAGALRAMGIGPGDAFGLLSRNTFRNCELVHAGYWMGAIPVPVNIRLAPPEIRYILDNAGAKVIGVEDVFLELLDSEALAPWADTAFCVSKEPPAGADLPHYEALIADAEPAPLRDADPDDTAILFYTGGTTGRSKGVQLSHLNVVSNGLQCGQSMGFGTEHTYLHVAPMFHSADLLGTGTTLMGGSHAYLPQFTPTAFLETVQDLRVTHSMLAPTMIILILQQEDVSRFDLSSLQWFLYGSAPMAAEWVKRTIEAFPGVKVEQGYGLTETSPILTWLPMDEQVKAIEANDLTRLKAAGRPVIGVDMRIVDENGNEVPQGEAGEVIVRAPNVTKGYLNLPEENARAFRDGWFHTGDVGRFDDEGFMYLVDRKKDMIITGGENVYTLEVEAAIYQHPDVSECAVVGVPDDKYGEALFAAIVPQPGKTLTAEVIIEHCRSRIGGYKIPRQFAFLPEMPKSAMGKILKTELRKTYSDPGEPREKA